MAGRSSRVKMRSRPIDVNKALFFADTSQREPDEQEIEQALASIPGGGAAQGGGGHGGHGHSGHTGQGDGTVSGVGIPTPPIFIDLEYHKRFDYGKFSQPSFYIKAHQTAGTGLVNQLDRYDLLQEDIEWLAAYNAAAEAKRPPGPTMSEDDMERMIDLFEKEAGKITTTGMRAEMMSPEDKITPTAEFPLVRAIVVAATTIHVRTKILEPVYDYWMGKRRRLGKALMRQYQEAPPRGNTDPHVAFRLRTEGRRISKRNPRKDDTSGYQKMHYLKRDFTKIVDIIDNIQLREQLKRESALLNIHIFDARLQATPWCQKLLSANPAVATAIASLNAVPPPPSSVAGAPPPALPPSLVTPEHRHLFTLLHSLHPACTYNRQELDAERKKKMVRNAAGAAAAAAVPSSHKRPSQAMGGSARPSEHRHGGDSRKSHHTAEQRLQKELRRAARREHAERSAALGLGLGGGTILEEEMEEMELTDEEDFLSEDEQDQRFYEQVEAHVKRVRLNAPGTDSVADSLQAVKAEQGVLPVAPAPAPATAPPPPPRAAIPPGGKVGYVRGVVGRGNLVWLECIMEAPAQLPQPQAMHLSHSQHALVQQHALHAHAQHSHAHMQPQSQSQFLAVPGSSAAVGVASNAPVASSSSSGAAPMDISGSPMPPMPPAIRAQ